MRAIDVLRLFVLSAVWGGSFIFIRIAAPVLGAIATAEIRVTIAAVALVGYAALMRMNLEAKARWRQYLIIGMLNSAMPMALIAWAEVRLTASMAAILNATTPLFGMLVRVLWLKERLTVIKVLGIAVAILGVAILVGWSPMRLDTRSCLAIGASLSGALLYGISATYTKVYADGAPAIGLATGSQVGSSVFLAFLLPFGWPAHPPTNQAVVSVTLLALLSTALAYILFFRLLTDVGPMKTLTVTFLAPIFGMLWSFLFLHEPLTGTKVLACGVVLIGTWLVTRERRT